MEDRIQIKVLQIHPGTLNVIDVGAGFERCIARPLAGSLGLARCMQQFLMGAPIINYGTLQFGGTAPNTDSRFITIDTVRPAAFLTQNDLTTSSAPYSTFTSGLYQNLPSSKKSALVGGGCVLQYVAGSGFKLLPSNHISVEAKQSDGTTIEYVNPGETKDFYESGTGNYLLTVSITQHTTGTGWVDGTFLVFSAISPDYTEQLNWNGYGSQHWFIQQHTVTEGTVGQYLFPPLFYDAGRKVGLSPSDPISDYDIQGISLQPANTDRVNVYPAVAYGADPRVCGGEFFSPENGTGNGACAPITAARASTSDPSTAVRGPDDFLMFRGPGYIRMLGRTQNQAGTAFINPENDSVYFFGMFETFLEVDKYPNPMAFLGQVGTVSTNTVGVRPWWRTSKTTTTTTDSEIYSQHLTTAAYMARQPFVLRPGFSFSGDNTPNEAWVFVSNGNSVPDLRVGQQGSGTNSTAGATYAQNRACIITDFEPSMLGQAYSRRGGFAGVRNSVNVYLEAFGGPQIRQVAFFKLDPDEYDWSSLSYIGKDIEANGTAGLDDRIESIGAIPGIYRATESERYTSAGNEVALPSASTFEYYGRNLYAVIGADTSVHPFSAEPGAGRNGGTVLFDLDEI